MFVGEYFNIIKSSSICSYKRDETFLQYEKNDKKIVLTIMIKGDKIIVINAIRSHIKTITISNIWTIKDA